VNDGGMVSCKNCQLDFSGCNIKCVEPSDIGCIGSQEGSSCLDTKGNSGYCTIDRNGPGPHCVCTPDNLCGNNYLDFGEVCDISAGVTDNLCSEIDSSYTSGTAYCNNDCEWDTSSCKIESPSCNNGEMDGDETGVDCGGSCDRCEVTCGQCEKLENGICVADSTLPGCGGPTCENGGLPFCECNPTDPSCTQTCIPSCEGRCGTDDGCGGACPVCEDNWQNLGGNWPCDAWNPFC